MKNLNLTCHCSVFITIIICLFQMVVSAQNGTNNEDCQNAESVVCGSVVSGVTTEYSTTYEAECCGQTPQNVRWYKFVGTADRVFCDVVSPNVGLQPEIAIYTGHNWSTCEELQCMSAGAFPLEDICTSDSSSSQMSFLSINGNVYLIAVYGSNYEIGMEFTLSINCTPWLYWGYGNDQPSDATAISLNQWDSGNFVSSNPTCTTCEIEGIVTSSWYEFYFDPADEMYLVASSSDLDFGLTIYNNLENPEDPLELIQCFDEGSCYYHIHLNEWILMEEPGIVLLQIFIHDVYSFEGYTLGLFDDSVYEVPCNDPMALNYNPMSVCDSECEYNLCEGCGCTDPDACNYDVDATTENGLCEYNCNACADPFACNYDPCSISNENCQYTSLTGILFYDGNGNGIFEENSEIDYPLSGVVIENYYFGTTTSDEQGYFEFDVDTSGIFYIQFSLPVDQYLSLPGGHTLYVELPLCDYQLIPVSCSTVNFPVFQDNYCTNQSITLVAPITNGAEYTWVSGEDTLSTDQQYTTVLNEAGEFEYSLFIETEACTNVQSYTYTVVESVQVNAGFDVVICEGDSALLLPSGVEEYLMNNMLITEEGVYVYPDSTTYYTITGTDNNGCQSEDEMMVQVNENPTISAFGTMLICEGDSTLIDVNGAPFIYFEGEEVSPDGIVFFPLSTTSYQFTGIDENGCVGGDEITITVSEYPDNTVTTNGPIFHTQDGEFFQWYLNGEPIEGATDDSYIADEDGYYTVEITNPPGCSVISEPILFVSVQSPEETGFVIYPNPFDEVITISSESEIISITIYDVTGKIVFEKHKLPGLNTEVQLGDFSSGKYIIECKMKNRSVVQSIEKN